MSASSGPPDVPRLSSQEIEALARRIVTNEVFITGSLELLETAFGFVLGMGMRKIVDEHGEDAAEAWSAQVGAVYEEYAAAGPRSVNGCPVFFSAKLLHRGDLPALIAHVDRMRAALGLPVASGGA